MHDEWGPPVQEQPRCENPHARSRRATPRPARGRTTSTVRVTRPDTSCPGTSAGTVSAEVTATGSIGEFSLNRHRIRETGSGAIVPRCGRRLLSDRVVIALSLLAGAGPGRPSPHRHLVGRLGSRCRAADPHHDGHDVGRKDHQRHDQPGPDAIPVTGNRARRHQLDGPLRSRRQGRLRRRSASPPKAGSTTSPRPIGRSPAPGGRARPRATSS